MFPEDLQLANAARKEYESALSHYEKSEFGVAAAILGQWRAQCRTDDAVLVLLYKSVEAMVKGTPSGHPVWELTEK